MFEGESVVGTALKTAYKATHAGGTLEALRFAIRRAAGGHCPSCGRTDPDELDHYLPSSKYAEFALFPLNLVPLCGGCNRKKSNRVPEDRAKSYIHAYLDDIPDVKMHRVELKIASGTLVATFHFDPADIDDKDLAARMDNQFTVMDVNYQISFEAEQLLREIVETLSEEWDEAGAADVADYLRQAGSRLARRSGNAYWKAALYRALADNDAFCEGGWKLAEAA